MSPAPSSSAIFGSGGLLLVLSVLTGCASSGPAAPQAAADNANNVVISSGGGGGGGKVIFKGRDNLLESSQRNSTPAPPANDQSVLIIEGSQNHLSYSADGVTAPARPAAAHGPDTTIIKANGLRQDVRLTGPNAGKKAALPKTAVPKVPPPTAAPPANVVQWQNEVVDVAHDAAQAAANYDEREVLVSALKGYVPVGEALQHYARLAQQGQVEALYQMALIYRSSAALAEQKKAVDYLEAAARKSHGSAALELAELYEQGLRGWGGTVLEPNRQKAKYYYLLGLKNGGQLSESKVQEINRW
ncbi:SEL1-like repeat protein [Hymenobacter jeollabukensis]|uniref:Sel1 repeat family protein n=1 Tax=Hymenobacter jeollabukensis TaxID=2025313 RepID=A0A5R8WM12_9BACT|nr:sel1 repeat family protein [Hymenobacter jeollabukensis]TLM90397.1 sel1 repeat family protein [Hymenobacter jeollabukensis]